MERFKLLSSCVSLTYWKIHLFPIDFWAFYHKFISFFFYIKWCYAWNSYSVPLLPHYCHIFTTGALPCVLLEGWACLSSPHSSMVLLRRQVLGTHRTGLKSQLYPLLAVYPGRTVVLEKTLESPSDCKEIQPVHSKSRLPIIILNFKIERSASTETL